MQGFADKVGCDGSLHEPFQYNHPSPYTSTCSSCTSSSHQPWPTRHLLFLTCSAV
jgi:hypothetical protein